MYRTCIFCSADLGTNNSVEEFPVGRRLAFDAWKGRLWAVCLKCGRWNLAPIEERWEAVESSEKLFRDARLRVQSENIGLAKLPDGTRLIRVGEALPGELAAWRYGGQLLRRRRQYLIAAGAVGLAAVAVGGLAVAGVLGGAGGLINVGNLVWQHRKGQRLVHRIPAGESPTAQELRIQRYQLNGARIVPGRSGDVAVQLPEMGGLERHSLGNGRGVWRRPDPVVLEGNAARTVLGQAMVDANARGASRAKLASALDLLAQAGGADEYLRGTAQSELALGLPHVMNPHGGIRFRQFAGMFRGDIVPPLARIPGPRQRRRRRRDSTDRLGQSEALALEMALHEETERRALEGELALLEAAWREAEEIAGIADTLPEDPLSRLGR